MLRRFIRTWWVVVVLALVAGGTFVSSEGVASAATCPGWNVVPSPNATSFSNHLNGVVALSSTNAWAVGYSYNGSTDRTLIEHWNGIAWHVKPSPNVGTSGNELDGITAASATSMWAVGVSNYPSGPFRTLVLHWNGTAWKVQRSRNVGTRGSWLTAADAVSGDDVWAVGFSIGSTNLGRTLVEHWNGTSWVVQTSPNVSPSSKQNQLTGIAATSGSNAWAAGYHTPPARWAARTLVERWNGTAWKVQTSANPGTDDELAGIAARSSADAWAVGFLYNGTADRTLIEHWNGTAWHHKATPNIGGSSINNDLTAVTAISRTNAWAVGSYQSGAPLSTLAEHWNGTTWAIVTTPNGGTYDHSLDAVAATAAHDVWAVGYYNNGSQDRTFVEHYC